MKKSFFDLMKLEASAYYSLESIEKQIDSSSTLASVPIQPLYSVLKKLDAYALAEVIPRLSKKQEYILQHLDLWVKDDIHPESFGDWICAYAECLDEKKRFSFIQSSSFLLYLKSIFNIWTFDVEDPLYPDHDYYFLTEDSLLLFEYHPEYQYVDEIKSLIKDLYTELGVERAYSHLFKVISDEYLNFLEDEYNTKKGILADYGLIDYFVALEKTTSYPSVDVMKNRLSNLKVNTPKLDNISSHQNLPSVIIDTLSSKDNLLAQVAPTVSDEQRSRFLRFDFIQLVNSILTLDQSLSKGSIAVQKSCQKVNSIITLGVDYLCSTFNESQESVLNRFSITECYKAGATLLRDGHKKIKESLSQLGIHSIDKKFGDLISSFFENYESGEEKYFNFRDQSETSIKSLETYQLFKADLSLFLSLIEQATPLMASFIKMKESGHINDFLYLNYKAQDVDFESLILSMFANHILKVPKESKKLGLTTKEFRKFTRLKNERKDFDNEVAEFLDSMNFEQSKEHSQYLHTLVEYHLEGYDFSQVEDEELRYVGGIIILNDLS